MPDVYIKQIGALTIRVILLSILLTILLATSSTYLALKIGILPAASIPAAILAMAVLRFFKNATIHETNLIQTAASAGEAVAGGIVFVLPALVIIHYWAHFHYSSSVAIALLGGLFGILFSVPLRRILINMPGLHFPEARAIAEVLRATREQSFSTRAMILGVGLSGIIEFAQTGFKLVASAAEYWVRIGHSTILGFGVGFSPALIGVGYLLEMEVGLSLLVGALISWGVLLPLLSTWLPPQGPFDLAGSLVNYRDDIHYIGLGAMLVAGLWTLFKLLKPFYQGLRSSLRGLFQISLSNLHIEAAERDIPAVYLFLGFLGLSICAYLLLVQLFPSQLFRLNTPHLFILVTLVYVIVAGFTVSVICGYFSGLVGVTASPGSAIVIAGLLLIAVIVRAFLLLQGNALTSDQLLAASGVTIIVGAIVAGTACIANDNIQDLKVGHLIGTQPWQQQIMLIIGVIVAAFVIPYVMELLFKVYGLSTVFPHEGMNPAQALSAPPATMMAGLAQGVFNHTLPWSKLEIGAIIMLILIVLHNLGLRRISLLGVSMGIYLPISSSIPLFIGSFFAFWIERVSRVPLQKEGAVAMQASSSQEYRTVLLACGLIAGAAIMDVLLAIPVSLTGNPMLFAIIPVDGAGVASLLGFLSVLGLGYAFYRASLRVFAP